MEPKIDNILENNNVYHFTLSGVNVSIANALRRIVLSEIPTVVFRTETHDINQCTITKNTTRLHNEILKQRLSCIPVHMPMKDINLLPGSHILEVDVKNNTDSMIFVTTQHFRIKNKDTNTYLSEQEQRNIFPPNRITNSYIDFARLRPKISDSIPGEELQFTAEFSISNALTNSMFNVVSKCSYGNTPDASKINDEWKKKLEILKKQENVTEKYINFQEKNFRILDAQRYYKENSFDFVIQSVGVYDNKDIVKTGAKILYNKFSKLLEDIDTGIVKILISDTTIQNCFDIYLENEDYTIGKVLEYILYTNYFNQKDDKKKLSFCGFKKFHPHDNHSIIRLSFVEESDKSNVQQYLHVSCKKAMSIFADLEKLLPGSD
jgi:DNA-directed RNA polymerase alpha subunit/DNA-directed RNA polymerase subunit L